MTESIEEKELTKKELTAEWKKIYNYFSNPICTAKDCYGRGYTGVNTKTGKVIGCEKKGCAVFKLKRFELKKRREERLVKEKNEGAIEGTTEGAIESEENSGS